MSLMVFRPNRTRPVSQRSRLAIDDEEARSGMRESSLENGSDTFKFLDLLGARAERLGDLLYIHIRIAEIHADEMRGPNRRPHYVAPQVLQQPIFVVHEADEDGGDGVLRRRPEGMDGEQATAVPYEADSRLAGGQPDPDAEWHRPTQPAATGREIDVPESQAHRHILHDGILGRSFGDDMGRPIEVPQHGQDQRIARPFA